MNCCHCQHPPGSLKLHGTHDSYADHEGGSPLMPLLVKKTTTAAVRQRLRHCRRTLSNHPAGSISLPTHITLNHPAGSISLPTHSDLRRPGHSRGHNPYISLNTTTTPLPTSHNPIHPQTSSPAAGVSLGVCAACGAAAGVPEVARSGGGPPVWYSTFCCKGEDGTSPMW